MSAEKVSEVVDTSADVATLAPKTDYKYYDYHPTKEDLMGESVPQDRLIDYLRHLLLSLFDKHNFIASNINIYQKSGNVREYPIAPDLALFKDVEVPEEEQNHMRSWKLYEPNRPAPSVVFEICSNETWHDDLNKKPGDYLRLGVKEYFAYDPEDPPLWREKRKRVNTRLRGWKYENDTMTELKLDAQGRLWSEELNCYLVQDVGFLRFYDFDGNRILSTYEQLAVERRAKEAAIEEAEAERRAKEELLEKLRKAGLDPDKL